MIVIAPNRRGLWARVDTTPFGFGQPYSKGQLARAAARNPFLARTLRGNPLRSAVERRSYASARARVRSPIGCRLGLPGAGLHVVEASKQLYRPVLLRKSLRRSVPVLQPALAPLAFPRRRRSEEARKRDEKRAGRRSRPRWATGCAGMKARCRPGSASRIRAVAETLARAGFDTAVLDMQHGAFDATPAAMRWRSGAGRNTGHRARARRRLPDGVPAARHGRSRDHRADDQFARRCGPAGGLRQVPASAASGRGARAVCSISRDSRAPPISAARQRSASGASS